MSLETRLQALAAAIGADIKALNTAVAAGGGLNKAALLALQGAAAFHRNVRTRGTVSTPPTITVGTSTAPAGHSRSYTFGAAGHPFGHTGGRVFTSGGRTIFYARATSVFTWRVSTVVDSDSVAFLLDSVTANGYRFIVDGQYVSATPTNSSAGSERYYRLQFASKARRVVVVEGNEGLGFWGSAVPDDGQCIKPADFNGPQMLYVGDSNAYFEGFPQKGDSCAVAMADFLGFRGAWVNAFSGTGFVVNGGNLNYPGRQADWTTSADADSLDLIVFQQSYNDREQSKVTEKANIANCIAQARARHPGAVILVHGVNSWNHAGSDVTNFQLSETAAAEAVAEANDSLVGFIPIYNAPGGTAQTPIIGTSAAGDTGTGNTPRYVSHAADHMNTAGNIYFGQWLARKAIEKLAAMGGIDVPALNLSDVATAAASGPTNLTTGTTAPSSPSEGDVWVDTAPLTPADFWEFQRFAGGNPVASSLFSAAAISGGSANTNPPTSANLGYNPDGSLLRSSTTANGGYRLNSPNQAQHIFGGGVSRKFRGQYMPATDFTGRLVRIGFLDATTSADAVDGAYFELNGATCSAKTANNSTRTTHATTLTLTLGTFYTFDIDVNSDGTSARFRVYAGISTTPVLDVTITTNIPTAQARGFGVGIVATEASTTASDIGILYGMGYGTVRAFERVMGPA